MSESRWQVPCKMEDTVYCIEKGEVIPLKVFGIHMLHRYQKDVIRIDCISTDKKERSYLKEYFGRYVFLTKEEAIKATQKKI